MSTFRLVEEPLGADALKPPTREEVATLWARARHMPIPDYEGVTLRRFRLPLAGRPR